MREGRQDMGAPGRRSGVSFPDCGRSFEPASRLAWTEAAGIGTCQRQPEGADSAPEPHVQAVAPGRFRDTVVRAASRRRRERESKVELEDVGGASMAGDVDRAGCRARCPHAPEPVDSCRHLRPAVATRRWAPFAAVMLMLLAAACGSGGVATTTSRSPAAAKTQISRAYDTLFNFATGSISSKVAVIEDGNSLRTALSEALKSSLAKSATGARVRSVTLLSDSACNQAGVRPPCAKVQYDLLGKNGAPLFSTVSKGYAVARQGSWLVAKSTVCGLLSLFYSASGRSTAPPGC